MVLHYIPHYTFHDLLNLNSFGGNKLLFQSAFVTSSSLVPVALSNQRG